MCHCAMMPSKPAIKAATFVIIAYADCTAASGRQRHTHSFPAWGLMILFVTSPLTAVDDDGGVRNGALQLFVDSFVITPPAAPPPVPSTEAKRVSRASPFPSGHTPQKCQSQLVVWTMVWRNAYPRVRACTQDGSSCSPPRWRGVQPSWEALRGGD